jgi:hypothetical protein
MFTIHGVVSFIGISYFGLFTYFSTFLGHEMNYNLI